MTFKEATSRLTGMCITLADIARKTGKSDASIRRARLDPESAAYRTPPATWRAGLAGLARERAADLEAFAEQLEQDRGREPS